MLNANPKIRPCQPPGGGGATVTATGIPPNPCNRHAAAVHGGSFYVFGGFGGTSRVSDLHGFDVDQMMSGRKRGEGVSTSINWAILCWKRTETVTQ